MKRLVTLIFAVLLGGTASASVDDDPAYGRWLVENGRAIVEIGPCAEGADSACGRIVWLARPVDEGGMLKTDVNNPDPALQVRPLCGLELIGGFARAKEGEWTGGWIYNARDGKLYDAHLTVDSGGQLEVRGYVGLTFLGSSQYWTRVSDPAPGCPD